MGTASEKTSADLQREIDQDRQRIGQRIDAIQERMSPGQLVDEAIAYAKGSGGGEYLSNLGNALKTNPLPVALMGVSLAWLMAKGTGSPDAHRSSHDASDYPLYVSNGPVRRIGPPEHENGHRYSHFADSSGKRLKALTDERGHRAGHFVDEAGQPYRGFADASGKFITHISDETGAAFDTASGWISDKWVQAKSATSHAGIGCFRCIELDVLRNCVDSTRAAGPQWEIERSDPHTLPGSATGRRRIGFRSRRCDWRCTASQRR